jgi:ankyrin repeat protein
MNIFRPGFLKAVRNSDLENAEHYLKKDVMKYQEMTGYVDDRQAIHIAAENLDIRMVDLLCRYKADANCPRQSFPNLTPLISVIYYAQGTQEEKEDMIALLCEKGADINSDKAGGITKHVIASGAWDLLPKLVSLGLDLSAQPSLVSEMISRRADNKMIRAMIDAGAKISEHAYVQGDGLRVLPTHVAAQTGNVEILGYLLDKGQDPNARTLFNNDSYNDEDDVVRRAFADRSGETLDLLLKRGGSKASAEAEWKYLRQGKSSAEMQASYAQIEKIMSQHWLAWQTKLEPTKPAAMEPRVKKIPPPVVIPTPIQPKPESPWKKLDHESIAHIKGVPALGRRITEIFNFSSCERRTITENVMTKAESTETQKFADIDQKVLKAAIAAFEEQGGAVDHTRVFGRKPISNRIL